MTNILLFFSLILNAAAIFAIIVLYLRQNRLVEAEKKQGKIIKEIEEVFTSYLLELKDENENFIKMFGKMSHSIKGDGESPPQAKMEQADSNGGTEGLEHTFRGNKGISYQAAKKAYKKNNTSSPLQEPSLLELAAEETVVDPPETDHGVSERDLFDQVLNLKKQDRSIEEIARILNKGKTEIELMLKFRQK